MINIENVPPELRRLIPLVQQFGITDDWAREDRLKAATSSELAELKRAVLVHDDSLDRWLADPGASETDEYIKFSAMRMAADSVPDR